MSSQNGIAHLRKGSLEETDILTTYQALRPVNQADEAGAEAYLIKPLSLLELEQSISDRAASFSDMVELRRLNSQLQARNEELEAFAHTVAHQLKNSSSLVTMFGHILKAYGQLPEAMPAIFGWHYSEQPQNE